MEKKKKSERFIKVNIINNTHSDALSILISDISHSFLQNVQFILTSQYPFKTSTVQLMTSVITQL